MVKSVTARARDTWPAGMRPARRLQPSEYRRRSSFVRFTSSWITSNPVAGMLRDSELRAWLALVACVVERDDPEGWVPDELRRFVTPRGSRRVTERDVAVFVEVGLLERVDGRLRVRDYHSWNPVDSTGYLRQRAWRERRGWREWESRSAAVPADSVRPESTGSALGDMWADIEAEHRRARERVARLDDDSTDDDKDLDVTSRAFPRCTRTRMSKRLGGGLGDFESHACDDPRGNSNDQ